MTALNKHAELRKELSNPAIGSKDHLRKLALSLLDELEAAEKRIAELEARTVSVKLPVVPSQYETLKLCLEPSDGYGMQKGAEYMRDEFIKALTAAGISVKGE